MPRLVTSAFVLRRNWAPVIGSLVLLVAGLLVARGSVVYWPLGYLAAWFGLMFAPIFYLRKAFPRETATTLRATATAVSIEGHAELRHEDILEAKLLPRAGLRAVIVLALRGGKTLSLLMRDDEAKALVELLGARASASSSRSAGGSSRASGCSPACSCC